MENKYEAGDIEVLIDVLRNNPYFLAKLDEFNEKYKNALAYGDNDSEAYIKYASRLQGVRELVSVLLQPIAIETDDK